MSASRLESVITAYASCKKLEAVDACTSLEVQREDLHALMTALRDEGDFETVTLVTAIDRLPAEPRFEMQYMLLSLKHSDRVRVRVALNEDDASVASITDLWPGANFFERECYDMFGIDFAGHPSLRRLLMPDGYDHHPLKKDFPHHGIEPDRLYREWESGRAQLEEGGSTASRKPIS